MIEKFIQKRQWNWLRATYVSILMIGGVATAPLTLPVLPVETFVRYASVVGGDAGVRQERHEMGKTPQHFAERRRWRPS